MSEIITDKLTGRATAGDVTITSEGGSATFQLQQGLVKGWMNYDQYNGNTINDSFNVASLTDNGTGLGQQNHTNNMNNATYCTSALGGATRTIMTHRENQGGTGTVNTTSACHFNNLYNSSGSTYTNLDMAASQTTVAGDLA